MYAPASNLRTFICTSNMNFNYLLEENLVLEF